MLKMPLHEPSIRNLRRASTLSRNPGYLGQPGSKSSVRQSKPQSGWRNARSPLNAPELQSRRRTPGHANTLDRPTDVDMKKMPATSRLPNSLFPESRKFENQGLHRKLYRVRPGDYCDLAKIWNGAALSGDGQLEVVDGPPPGGPLPDLANLSASFAPEYHPAEICKIAARPAQAAR
jgi:hypothetical protein